MSYVIDGIKIFNLQVSAEDTLSIPLPIKSHIEHDLSQRIINCQFSALCDSGSLADRGLVYSSFPLCMSRHESLLPPGWGLTQEKNSSNRFMISHDSSLTFCYRMFNIMLQNVNIMLQM